MPVSSGRFAQAIRVLSYSRTATKKISYFRLRGYHPLGPSFPAHLANTKFCNFFRYKTDIAALQPQPHHAKRDSENPNNQETNTKQITNSNIQTPNSKYQVWLLKFWSLGIVWLLYLGIWLFRITFHVIRPVWAFPLSLAATNGILPLQSSGRGLTRTGRRLTQKFNSNH